MFTKRCISLLACCAFLFSFSQKSSAASLTISQVDYYQDGSLAVANSEWGQFDITYDQGTSMGWMNVLDISDPNNERWIIQNHPLLPEDVTDTSSFTSTQYFDLGVSRGENVTSTAMTVRYQYSADPLVSAPTTGTEQSVTVGQSQNIINSGVPSGQTTLNSPEASNISWEIPEADFSVNWHTAMPNVVQELKFCGPAAATNSLHWLAGNQKIDLKQTLTETQTELAAGMGNNNDGNWDHTEVQGKLKYIEEHNLAFEVHYTGGEKLPTEKDVNYEDPNGNGTARNDGAISWDWILEEMEKGQDIEFMTGTHWVVVEGVISWGDIHLFAYRDDPFQHGSATTVEEMATIGDRHVWSAFVNGKVDIGNGNETLRAAVAESPVPEPATMTLFGTGITALIGFSRRKNKKTRGINA